MSTTTLSPGGPHVLLGSAERLVGVDWVAFPPTIDRYVSISLLAVGISLIVVALFLLTRPVVDRRLPRGAPPWAAAPPSSGHATSCAVTAPARSTTSRSATTSSGSSTATRWSPTPSSAASAWSPPTPSDRSPSAPTSGTRSGTTSTATAGASASWAPARSGCRPTRHRACASSTSATRRSSTPRSSRSQGGKMKGLRQAVNRVARYGYTVDSSTRPASTRHDAARMAELMAKSRRGEQERGFSMMLGRLFDRRDTGPAPHAGRRVPTARPPPCASSCPRPPSVATRSTSCAATRATTPTGSSTSPSARRSTTSKAMGMKGLSLNFAALRSMLEGDNGRRRHPARGALGPAPALGRPADRDVVAVQREVRAGWLPRYIVFDSAEQFVPVVVQIMRAESLTEVPVIGRLLTTSGAKRSGPAVPEEVLAAQEHASTARPTGTRPGPRHRGGDGARCPRCGHPGVHHRRGDSGPCEDCDRFGRKSSDATGRPTTSDGVSRDARSHAAPTRAESCPAVASIGANGSTRRLEGAEHN